PLHLILQTAAVDGIRQCIFRSLQMAVAGTRRSAVVLFARVSGTLPRCRYVITIGANLRAPRRFPGVRPSRPRQAPTEKGLGIVSKPIDIPVLLRPRTGALRPGSGRARQ